MISLFVLLKSLFVISRIRNFATFSYSIYLTVEAKKIVSSTLEYFPVSNLVDSFKDAISEDAISAIIRRGGASIKLLNFRLQIIQLRLIRRHPDK